MSKIVVRRQVYANNGTHANEIEAVVQENLIANTLSSATDIAPSVGLLKSNVDSLNESLGTKQGIHGYKVNQNTSVTVTSQRAFDLLLVCGGYGGNSIFDLVTLHDTASSQKIKHLGDYSGVTITGQASRFTTIINIPNYAECSIWSMLGSSLQITTN